MESAEGSMPFVFVTVNGIPWVWLPGFARLGVWARSWGPLMRRMRRVLRWADWAGYLEEAKRQWGLTRNPEYLRFMTLRAEGLLEDNKILTPDSRSLLQGYAQWAHERLEREDKKQAKKARKAEK